MPFKQVKDMLERAVDFHGMLVDFYENIDNITDKESVKIVVEYMERHEKILKNDLSRISEKQKQSVLNGWVKYEPLFANSGCLDNLKMDKTSTVDDIVHAGLKLNQCLVDMYHQLADMLPPGEARDLFKNLEIMEVAEKKKLARVEGM